MHQVTIGNRLITPSKIVCVGRNYMAHIKELNNSVPEEMVLFVKQNSSISSDLISLKEHNLHYEGELCFVYEKGSFTALGFGFDLTKRKLQNTLKKAGLPWERAKSFDGSAVFTDFIAINTIPSKLFFELKKNNTLVQQGSLALMSYKPDEILAEILTFMSLNDGDIVMTGTPKGVGEISQNDIFSVRVLNDETTLIEDRWVVR